MKDLVNVDYNIHSHVFLSQDIMRWVQFIVVQNVQ